MIMGTNILFKTFVLIAAGAQSYEFPEAFRRCQLKDVGFENCLVKSIENAFHLIGSSGISSLGLPPIDPLQIISMEIGAGTSAVNLVQKYRNVKVYGLSNTKVEKAHLDMDKKILTFTVSYPEIIQEAEYNVNGKILVIPVYGSGASKIRLGEVTFENILNFKEISKNGKKFFHVEDYKLNITTNSAHYDFQNLFDGDKRLADNILKVINENWKVIFDDVKSGIEDSYSVVLKAIASRLFDYVPINDIFLE